MSELVPEFEYYDWQAGVWRKVVRSKQERVPPPAKLLNKSRGKHVRTITEVVKPKRKDFPDDPD